MSLASRRSSAPRVVVPRASLRALRPFLEPALELARHDSASDAAALYLVGADGRLTLAAHRGLGGAFARAQRRLDPGEGLVGRVWSSLRAASVADLRRGRRDGGLHGALARAGLRRAAGAPVWWWGRAAGVLLVAARAGGRGRARAAGLRGAAGLVGSALDLVQRHARAREAAAELATVRELGRAIVRALDLSETLKLVVEDAAALLEVPAAGVLLCRGPEGELELAGATAALEDRVGTHTPAAGTVHETVLATLRPRAEYEPHRLGDLLAGAGLRRAVVAPLPIGGEAIGTLFAGDGRADRFAVEDAALLGALAEPAAIGIQNARLVAELERRRLESDRLRQLATSLQRLELDSVLNLVVESARQLSGGDFALVALGGPTDLRFEASAGGPDVRGQPVPERSGTRWVFEHGEPLVSEDARSDERLDRAPAMPTGAVCLLPILGPEGPLGVLGVGYEAPRRVPPAQVRLLAALAAHASAAIQSARLFRAVQRGKREWEEAFDSIGEGIARVDREGRVFRANRAFAAFVQRDVRDVIGRRISDLLEGRVPESGIDPAALIAAALRSGQVAEGVCGLRSPYRVLRTAVYPTSEGVALVFRDVTAFASLEERHQRILEAAHDAIVIADLEGRLVFANPAAADLLGADVSALVGRPFREFVPDDPEMAAEVERRCRLALQGEPQRYETRIRRPDGEVRVAEVSNSPLRELDRAVGTVAVLRDITEKKALQAHLVQTEKLAALGSLLSGIAHELNNPLASISSFAQLLDDPGAPEGQRGLAREIHREAARAARIVQHLLTFARMRDPRRESIDVAQVLDEVLALRSFDLSAGAVEVHREYGPGLFVLGDPHALTQVLLNLVLNAQQAMEEQVGTRRLSITAAREDDRVVVQVDDTGPGIPPTQLHRIFDPFFTTKPEGQGTGLGLSVSYGIVRDHGGEISAANRPDGGARLRVSLPALAEAAEAPAAPPPTEAGAAADPRLKVLVIDDEPAIRRSLSTFLSRRGHAVALAADGAEALDRLLHEEYDAVVCDIRMPGLGGMGLFQRLEAERPEVVRRIVFTTGDVLHGGTKEFLDRSGQPYVVKPFDLTELEARVRGVAAR